METLSPIVLQVYDNRTATPFPRGFLWTTSVIFQVRGFFIQVVGGNQGHVVIGKREPIACHLQKFDPLRALTCAPRPADTFLSTLSAILRVHDRTRTVGT